MKDPETEAYVDAIEAHLRARRGTDHILNPRDFALARSWHEAGVPLATVLVGIDRAFDAAGAVSSLAFCRRFVGELAASGPPPQHRPAPPPESVPLREVEAVLARLLERLTALPPDRGVSFHPPLGKIREVLDLISVASRPNWSYVRAKLREIDDLISATILQALTGSEIEEIQREAARAIERHRGTVDETALRDARSRFTIQRARERLGLPRVSLV